MWSTQPGKELYIHNCGRLVFSIGFVEIYLTGCFNLNYLNRLTSRRAPLNDQDMENVNLLMDF